MINQRFRYTDALERVSGLFWARFWPSWGRWHLGVIWALLRHLNGTPNFPLFSFGDPGAPNVPPKQPSTDLNSAPGALIAKQKAPGSHQSPHFGTDVFRYLTILKQNPPTKRQQGTSPRHSRGDFGAVKFNVFLSFLLLMFCFCFFFCFSFFSSALSVSSTIITRRRPRRGLRLELRLRIIMKLGLRLGVRLRRRLRLRLRLSQSLRT